MPKTRVYQKYSHFPSRMNGGKTADPVNFLSNIGKIFS